MKIWHEHLLNNVTVWPKKKNENKKENNGIDMAKMIWIGWMCGAKAESFQKLLFIYSLWEKKPACQSMFCLCGVVCHFDSCFFCYLRRQSNCRRYNSFIHHFYSLILSSESNLQWWITLKATERKGKFEWYLCEFVRTLGKIDISTFHHWKFNFFNDFYLRFL